MKAAMGRRASFGLDSLIRALRIVPCIVSIVMLLLFPVAKAHTFGPHFRTRKFAARPNVTPRSLTARTILPSASHRAIRSRDSWPLPKLAERFSCHTISIQLSKSHFRSCCIG